MKICKGLRLALVLGVLFAGPSKGSAKVLARPVWRLNVQGDSTFTCQVIQNDFATNKLGSQECPVKFLQFLYYKVTVPPNLPPHASRLRHSTADYRRCWLRVSARGEVRRVAGDDGRFNITASADRRTLVAVTAGAVAEKTNPEAYIAAVRVVQTTLSGEPCNYRALVVDATSQRGILLAGDLAHRAAHFIDLRSGQVLAQVPGFVELAVSGASPRVAGSEWLPWDLSQRLDDRQGRVAVYDFDGKALYQGPWYRFPHAQAVHISADGEYVYYQREARTFVHNMRTGEDRLLDEVPAGEVAFSRDCSHIMIRHAAGTELYSVMRPEDPVKVWSYSHPEAKYTWDRVVANGGSYAALHFLGSAPQTLQLAVLDRKGETVSITDADVPHHFGLEFIGQQWLLEGIEYPDSEGEHFLSEASTTRTVTLYELQEVGE